MYYEFFCSIQKQVTGVWSTYTLSNEGETYQLGVEKENRGEVMIEDLSIF